MAKFVESVPFFPIEAELEDWDLSEILDVIPPQFAEEHPLSDLNAWWLAIEKLGLKTGEVVVSCTESSLLSDVDIELFEILENKILEKGENFHTRWQSPDLENWYQYEEIVLYAQSSGSFSIMFTKA